MQYRVFISTDLGGDPDDIQSLYRLLHYSDILKIEGIGSCTGPGSTPRAANIMQWAQRVDLDHLRDQGYSELMTEAEVLDKIRQGQTEPGAPTKDRSTEASRLLIERAHAQNPDEGGPLWVLVWGSITDVAQALHDDPSIAPKIRINYIGSSNTENDPDSRDWVYDFMKEEAPELWWIEDGIMPKWKADTFRGMYEGGEQSGEWGSKEFVHQNIRGHGSTHEGMFKELSGDAFPWAGDILKEGDTPTFLYLLSPVIGKVGDVDDPTQENWGGQFMKADPERFPNYYTDLDKSAKECRATISKWRVQQLKDWKSRWDRYGITE